MFDGFYCPLEITSLGGFNNATDPASLGLYSERPWAKYSPGQTSHSVIKMFLLKNNYIPPSTAFEVRENIN